MVQQQKAAAAYLLPAAAFDGCGDAVSLNAQRSPDPDDCAAELPLLELKWQSQGTPQAHNANSDQLPFDRTALDDTQGVVDVAQK